MEEEFSSWSDGYFIPGGTQDYAVEGIIPKIEPNIENILPQQSLLLNKYTIKAKKDHKCEECNLNFASALGLEKHKRQQHTEHTGATIVYRKGATGEYVPVDTSNQEPSIFQCPSCPKCFTRRLDLDKHAFRHSDLQSILKRKPKKSALNKSGSGQPKKSVSGRPKKSFAGRPKKSVSGQPINSLSGQFLIQVLTSVETKIHKCPGCSKEFTKNCDLKRHVTSVHLHQFRLKCGKCGHLSESYCNMKAHLKIECFNTEKKKFPPADPSQCLYYTVDSIDKKSHHQCSKCPKQFSTYSDLKRHVGAVHGFHLKLKCGGCGAESNNFLTLKDHMKIECFKMPSRQRGIHFNCPVCSKSFLTKGMLANHNLVAHVGQRFQCDICQKGFYHKRMLQMHLNGHSGNKPFQCEKCDKSFSGYHSLYSHRSFAHSQKKDSHKCEICGKTFPFHSYLIRHLEFHAQARTILCDICGKSMNKDQLKFHMETHQGVRALVACKFCGKKMMPRGLKRHMRLHTGEKPCSCKECGKTFTQHSSLYYHMKSHHGAPKKPKPKISTKLQQQAAAILTVKGFSVEVTGSACSVCGKCFNSPEELQEHSKEHTDECK